MRPIDYRTGDATDPVGEGARIICHVCNGCGLAGGQWPDVESIVQRTLCAAGLSVHVYDL
ncbi:hypothetical protein [Sorangium sp. So ce204]|uniref:hypothetical protein n=1 Tax=Sorangium sp. So ce204 TaxID=3133288 RepID=UPI003F6152D9